MLEKKIETTKQSVKKEKKSLVKFGCSIMTNAWTDRNGKTLINFLVNTPIGTGFLKSIDANSEVEEAQLLTALPKKNCRKRWSTKCMANYHR